MTPWEDTYRAIQEMVRRDREWRTLWSYRNEWYGIRPPFEVDGLIHYMFAVGRLGLEIADARDAPMGVVWLSPTRARRLIQNMTRILDDMEADR